MDNSDEIRLVVKSIILVFCRVDVHIKYLICIFWLTDNKKKKQISRVLYDRFS